MLGVGPRAPDPDAPRGWALAARGPLVILLGLLGAGCLVPGPVEERPEQNLPLSIRRDQVRPSPETAVWIDRSEIDRERRAVVFSIREEQAVENPDQDEIFYFWYRDYNTVHPTPPFHFEESFELDPCGPLQEFRTKQSYALTVLVSDRTLRLDGTFRSFPAGASVQTETWSVFIDGTCPSDLPAAGGSDAGGPADDSSGEAAGGDTTVPQ